MARCIKLETIEKMAVKIVRKDMAWAGKKEVVMLKKLRGYVCLAFEMLDMSIYGLIKKRDFEPLTLPEIRVIV